VKVTGLRLRQRDGVTCGPSVAVLAGALLDPRRGAVLFDPRSGQALFAAEQGRVHAEVNVLWPRRLGTTPLGLTRAMTAAGATAGVPYRWRLSRGRCDRLTDVLAAVHNHRPVAMLIGRVVPRHWVLIVEAAGDTVECYEPSSGAMRRVAIADVRRGRLSGLGYPLPFAFIVPCSNV